LAFLTHRTKQNRASPVRYSPKKCPKNIENAEVGLGRAAAMAKAVISPAISLLIANMGRFSVGFGFSLIVNRGDSVKCLGNPLRRAGFPFMV